MHIALIVWFASLCRASGVVELFMAVSPLAGSPFCVGARRLTTLQKRFAAGTLKWTLKECVLSLT